MQLLKAEFSERLERLASDAPQAIILEGVCGHNASFEAIALADALLKAKSGGTVRTLTKPIDKTVITIEQIQTLYGQTRAKQAEGCNIWIIDDAEILSEPAQNAFLKLLEEPPAAVVFILTVGRVSSLLRTIQSRCRVVRCTPFAKEDASVWLAHQDITDTAEVQQLLFLSEGSATELSRLSEDTVYKASQLAAAGEAKRMIAGGTFDQIALISSLAGNREKALHVIKLALRILIMLAPQQASQPGYAKRLEAFSNAYEQLLQNGNVRLQLLRAVLTTR